MRTSVCEQVLREEEAPAPEGIGEQQREKEPTTRLEGSLVTERPRLGRRGIVPPRPTAPILHHTTLRPTPRHAVRAPVPFVLPDSILNWRGPRVPPMRVREDLEETTVEEERAEEDAGHS